MPYHAMSSNLNRLQQTGLDPRGLSNIKDRASTGPRGAWGPTIMNQAGRGGWYSLKEIASIRGRRLLGKEFTIVKARIGILCR